MRTLLEKAIAFRALHERDRAFIIPNPWDVGTARLLTQLGFEALATTSAGYAFSLGRRDYDVGRELMMSHVRAIVSATDLPVSADLENGFGDDPDTVATTILLAGDAGLAGGSIEDSTGRHDEPIYAFELAVERIRAAASSSRSLPYPFTLTGRAENHRFGFTDLKDTIRRLQAYQDAGADVLYAPGLVSREDIRAVVESVDRPVNVLMGSGTPQLTLDELSEIGVRRVSVGSALCRVALGAFIRAAREMRERGTFTFATEAINYRDINALFR